MSKSVWTVYFHQSADEPTDRWTNFRPTVICIQCPFHERGRGYYHYHTPYHNIFNLIHHSSNFEPIEIQYIHTEYILLINRKPLTSILEWYNWSEHEDMCIYIYIDKVNKEIQLFLFLRGHNVANKMRQDSSHQRPDQCILSKNKSPSVLGTLVHLQTVNSNHNILYLAMS